MTIIIDDGNTIELNSVINKNEINELRSFLAKRKNASAHNAIMQWLDGKQDVCKRLADQGMIKAYAAYVFEYYLNLK